MNNPSPSTPKSSATSGARRLTTMINEKFTDAFDKASAACGGERVVWDVFPVAVPNPVNVGQVMTGLAVYCSIASTILGQHLTITAMVEGGLVEADQAAIDEFVWDRVNELVSVRSQHAAEAEQQARAAENGHQAPSVPPTSGLIVPRR